MSGQTMGVRQTGQLARSSAHRRMQGPAAHVVEGKTVNSGRLEKGENEKNSKSIEGTTSCTI